VKLHKLTIENLNSLYGRQDIDFDASLTSAPVFLIVGPTGAGKSTILDAICLALFGETPRLRGTGKTGDPVKILSHGEAECRSILEFSKKTSTGRKRYRAEWYLYLARKKPGAAPQPPQRSLERWDEATEAWVPLVTRSKVQREFQPHFDDVLEGIVVDDFLRSVLLAQGEFTRFLKASEDEKARMLEKLTGTEEYSLYGSRAKKRFKKVDTEYQQLKNRMEGFGFLDEEPLEVLQAQKQEAEGHVLVCKQRLQQWQGREEWERKRRQGQARLSECKNSHQKAEQDLLEHEPEQQRLERHKHCRLAQEPWMNLQKRQAELEQAQQETRLLQARERECQPRYLQMQGQTALLKEQWEEARQHLETQRPNLQEARKQQLRYQQACKQQEETQLRLQKSATELREVQEQLQKSQRKVEQHQQQLRLLTEETTGLEHQRSLVEEWAEWRHRLQQLQSHQQLLEQRQNAWTQEKEALAAFLESQKSAEARTQEEQALLQKAEAEVSAGEVEIQSWLEEDEAEEAVEGRWQARLEQGRVLTQAVREGWDQWKRWQERRKDWEGESSKLTRLQEQKKLWQERLDSLRLELTEAEKAWTDFEPELRYASLSYRLVEERRQLQEGMACPLCRSEQHSFREHEDMAAFEREIEERFEAVSAEEIRRKEALQQFRQSITEGETHCRNKQQETREQEERCRQGLLRVEGEQRSLQACLMLTPLREVSAEALTLEMFQEELDKSDAAQKTARESLQQWRALFGVLQKNRQLLQSARHRWKTFQQEQTQQLQLKALREEQCQQKEQAFRLKQQETQAATEELRRDVEPLGLLCESDGKGDILIELTLQAWDSLREVLRGKWQRKAEEEDALRQQEQQTELLRKELARKESHKQEEEVKATQQKAESDEAWTLLQALLERLQGDDPDVLEAVWSKQVQELEQKLEKARSQEETLREEVTTIKHEKAHWTQNHQRCITEIAQLEIRLKRILVDLGLASRAELENSLLSEDEAQRIESISRTRQQVFDTSVKLLEMQKAAVAALEKEPPVLPEESSSQEWPLEALQLQLNIQQERLEEAQGLLGGVEERLKRQQEQSEAWRKMQEEKLELEARHKLWQEMDKLIGVGDGRNFRKFAQALNLRQIADGANANLQFMAPRYRLSVELKDKFPTLNFVVRDRHHANAERSLSTLSGGETFLVSLALALSLAELHARDLQIESLLLDEGFGTLDPETLEVALATLGRISSQSSQQIGIISHVEALKEKIEHKIVVHKTGNGRSRLQVEQTM
jgi:exonuclease SbcC